MKLVLEELELDDLPVIQKWIDPSVFRIFKDPVDVEQLTRLLSKYKGDEPLELGFRAVNADTGEIVGLLHAVLDHWNSLAHIQQIIVVKNLRGKGIGTEILTRFNERCFTELRLHRVQLFVDNDNTEAIACYKKAGFKTEGLMRDASKVEDGWVSWYSMSLLADEWLPDD
ncbi:GNAT family N-acetyltransferase [Acidobacteriota bacterium]